MSSGPDDEQVPSIFDEEPDLERQQRERELRRMRSVLLSSGILIVLPALIGHVKRPGFGSLTTLVFAAAALVVVGIYVILGSFAMRRPFTALLTGIGIYSIMQLAVIVTSPAEPFTAWMFRALVLLNLLMPLQRARQLQAGRRV